MNSPKIDLLIIGAQKAGTSAVNSYLGQHPDVLVSDRSVTAEFAYFFKDEFYNKGYDYCYSNWFKNLPKENEKIVAKHVGILYDEKSIQRVLEHNQKIKLLIILRDPVERAISAYNFYRLKAKETRNDFLQSFADEKLDFYDKGNYLKHLNNVLKYFSRENVHILIYENFKQNPIEILNLICTDVLEISPFTFNTKVRVNEGGGSKFKFISKFINRRWGSIKNIIPLKYRISLKSKINDLNKGNRRASPSIDDRSKEIIYQRYKDMITELESKFELDLSTWKKPEYKG